MLWHSVIDFYYVCFKGGIKILQIHAFYRFVERTYTTSIYIMAEMECLYNALIRDSEDLQWL